MHKATGVLVDDEGSLLRNMEEGMKQVTELKNKNERRDSRVKQILNKDKIQ